MNSLRPKAEERGSVKARRGRSAESSLTSAAALTEVRVGLKSLLESNLLIFSHERTVKRLLRLVDAQMQNSATPPIADAMTSKLQGLFERLRDAQSQLVTDFSDQFRVLRSQIVSAQTKLAKPVARHSIATILARGSGSHSVGKKQRMTLPPPRVDGARQTTSFAGRLRDHPRIADLLRVEVDTLQRSLQDERKRTVVIARQSRFRAVEESLRIILALSSAQQQHPTAVLAAKIERLLSSLNKQQITTLSALWTGTIERIEDFRACEEESGALRASTNDARIEASKAQLENLALQHLRGENQVLRKELGKAPNATPCRAFSVENFMVLKKVSQTGPAASESDLVLGLKLLCEFVEEMTAEIDKPDAMETVRRKALIALSLAESLKAIRIHPAASAPSVSVFLLRTELLRRVTVGTVQTV